MRNKKALKKKADKLWSEIIRQKNNGRCEICGILADQPHHIIGRSNLTVRWNVRNGCLLCHLHHTINDNSAHRNPRWFQLWVQQYRLDDYEYLLKKRKEVFGKDYIKILEYLGKYNIKGEKND